MRLRAVKKSGRGPCPLAPSSKVDRFALVERLKFMLTKAALRGSSLVGGSRIERLFRKQWRGTYAHTVDWNRYSVRQRILRLAVSRSQAKAKTAALVIVYVVVLCATLGCESVGRVSRRWRGSYKHAVVSPVLDPKKIAVANPAVNDIKKFSLRPPVVVVSERNEIERLISVSPHAKLDSLGWLSFVWVSQARSGNNIITAERHRWLFSIFYFFDSNLYANVSRWSFTWVGNLGRSHSCCISTQRNNFVSIDELHPRPLIYVDSMKLPTINQGLNDTYCNESAGQASNDPVGTGWLLHPFLEFHPIFSIFFGCLCAVAGAFCFLILIPYSLCTYSGIRLCRFLCGIFSSGFFLFTFSLFLIHSVIR